MIPTPETDALWTLEPRDPRPARFAHHPDSKTMPHSVTARTAGLVPAVVGAIVMGGWLLRLDAIVQILPTWVPMQFNTALGFFLCGVSLIQIGNGRQRGPIVMAAFAAAIGLLTLTEYASGASLGIDELFVRHHLMVKTSHPGRMSPNSAICFIVIGLALVLLARVPRRVLTLLLATMVTGLGIVALLGYVAGIETLYLWGVTGMAMHTSVCFIALGVGTIALVLHAHREHTYTPRYRRVLSLGVGCSMLIISASASLGLLSFERQLLGRLTTEFARIERESVSLALETRVDAIAFTFGDDTDPGASGHDRGIERLFKTLPSLVAVAWAPGPTADPQVRVRPGAGPIPPGAFEPPEATHHPTGVLTRVLPAGEGDPRRLIAVTLPQPGTPAPERVTAVFDARALLAPALAAHEHDTVTDVTLGGVLVYADPRSSTAEDHPRLAIETTPSPAGLAVRARPSVNLYSVVRTHSPWATLVVGVFLAVALSGAIHLGHRAVTRTEAAWQHQVQLTEHAERERSEQQIRGIVDAAPVGMLLVDASGTIRLVNTEIERMFGYTRDELIGQVVEVLVPRASRAAHPELRDSFYRSPSTRRMGAPSSLHGLRKDGAEVPVDIGLTPFAGDDGVGVVASVVDVTEQRLAQKMLAALNTELETRNKELDAFVHTVSHDLKSPLITILGHASYMLSDIEDGRPHHVADQATSIKQAALLMRQNIDELLELSSLGRVDETPEHTRVADTLDEVLTHLRAEIEAAGVTICTRFECETIRAVRIRLVQVLQNLIANAIRYAVRGPGETIEVGTIVEPGAVRLYVRDAGPGIAPEHHDTVFGLFQRLPSDKEGTGIGLALVRRVAELHSGRAWVESTPGHGATFCLTFPTREGSRPTHEDGPAERAASPEPTPGEPALVPGCPSPDEPVNASRG